MKTKDYLFSAHLVALMIVNTVLDYNAICEYFDVEPFKLEQLGVGNLIGLVAAFGVALMLSVAAQKVATCEVQGRKRRRVVLLVLCGVSCFVVAAFRLSYEAASAGRSISGGALASMNIADVFFAAMMLGMLVGEVLAAYYDRLREHEREAAMLSAAILRIEADLANIDEQAATAARAVNARINETLRAVNAANEIVYESALNRAGELQNSFVGYVAEGEKARAAHAQELQERLEGMLIPFLNGGVKPSDGSTSPSNKFSGGYQRCGNTAEVAAIAAA